MKKVGVLTHYYNSKNYGGMLQAYALIKTLSKLGFDAEQICYKYETDKPLSNETQNVDRNNSHNIKDLIKKSATIKGKILYKLKYIKKRVLYNKKLKTREKRFLTFEEKIPHSSYIYTSNDISLCNKDYDAFIVGSDQVWNLWWYNAAFFLEFAETDKLKIAYAASAGKEDFDEIEKQYLKKVLIKFDSISVREKDLVNQYKSIANVNSTHVLDPVMLLNVKDWDLVSSERLIKDNYIFCFFYNPTDNVYSLVKDFAKKNNKKIAIIPYAHQASVDKLDCKYGDYRFTEAGPREFISLIKNSDYVFTDSFHCAVFSILYNIKMFVFTRNQFKEMSSRILSLVELFKCEERFCDREDKINLNYVDMVKNKDYSFEKYYKLKNISISYLTNSLMRKY